MTIETKSLSNSGMRTKAVDAGTRRVRVVDSIIDHSSFNAWKDTVNYKAVAFESGATKDALLFEIQQKRAQWDPVAGQFRCPPETPAAGQFTNRLGEGCTTGFVRRLAARLGERLTQIGQGVGARRLSRGRDTELGVGAGVRRTGEALEDWAQVGVDTPLMQARRARALARRGTLPSGAPSPRATRRQRIAEMRQRMLDRVSRLRELGRRVDWGWNEDLDEQIRRRQGIPGAGAGSPAPPVPTPGVPGPTPTPGAPGPTPTPRVPGPTPTPGVPGPTPTPGVPGPTPTPSVPGPTPTPGVPGPTPRPTPSVPGPTPRPTPGVPGPTPRPTPGVPGPTPRPGRPPRPGRAPQRPSTSPTGGRAGYVAALSRNKRVSWLITNGIDPDSGIPVHSPRNQDWIDLSNEIFPGVMPDGKTFKTMTGDELDNAYRAFMAIASDPTRTDDERVIAARMAGKIAGQSRVASRKWEEFNNEWDAAIAGARTEDERDALRAARDDAARELVARIGVFGSITRERRDRSQAKMPRQDAAPDDWYQYVNDITALSPVGQTQVNLPSPVQPDEGETDVPEAQAPPASPLMPSTPSPRQPRREDRRGEETVSAPQQPAATPDTATPETEPRAQGGRGTRTGSRGQQTTVVGGRSVADLTIEELLDQMERSDDQKERRAQAKKNRVPFNERIIKAPDGRATGKRLRKELGVPDPDKYLIDYTAEELDNLFEQMWNIMSDPAETMLRRRMARSVLRSIENDNERRTSRAGLTRGRRSIYPAGQFGFGYNYRDYVAPRRNNVWNDFVNLPAEEFQSKYGYTNTPMPPGWRPLTESEYGTARYVSPYLSRPENVSPDDPPAFSTGDDISLGTKEPSTEVGAVTGELVDELDATLSDAGFSDADKASAKADLVKHIERVARDQEEETGDISDEVRDAYGIARGKAEEDTQPTREAAEAQTRFFENPPILYNGNSNPSYSNEDIRPNWLNSFQDNRTGKRIQIESTYRNLLMDGASEQEALQRAVEVANDAINWRKTRGLGHRFEAALDTDEDTKAGSIARALEVELDALALQYALDDFIEETSRTLSPETVKQMGEEVAQRATWRAGKESLIEGFDPYPQYHSDSAAANEGRFVGIFDAITGLWTSISRSADEDFWENFGNSLARISLAARTSSRPAERAALEKLYDGLLRLHADRDIDVLMTELWASILNLTPQNEDFVGGLIPNRAGNVSPASAFHYYHFDPITGGSKYFTSRAVGLQSEINIMKSRISDALDTGQANPELAQILESMNGWTERFSDAAQAIVDDAKELDRDIVAVIREQIQGLRRIAVERQTGASSTSIAEWIDRNAHPLISDQSITIDDIGVSPRVGQEVRSNAQAFLDSIIHTMSGVEGPGIDGVVSVPKILQTGETDPALEDVVGFLREFDDPWFSQTLLDSIEGMRAEGDASIARIISGYVPPVNTGRVDIDSPDQLDTTPPTEEMGQRIRNLVRSVFAQRADRQRGRYASMYPDTTPWNDPTLDDLFQRAVNGDFSARENIIGLAYTMPEFEVEIVERESDGTAIRNADGTPKTSKWLFRVDPDSIRTDSAGANGYVQARRSDESDWVNIGHFQRFVQWSNGHVSHSHLKLGNQASDYLSQQGVRLGDKLKASGFSETFNGHALRVLRRAGFKTVGVSAGWDGAYVWGRAGFRNGGNRTRMASAMRDEVAQWNRGRLSIVRSQDQANLWEYVAGRLVETPDNTDPYDHIEAIVAIDDSATIADPDERKQRSAEIMRWFLNNASFSSGALDIAEVYGSDPPYAPAQSIPTDINPKDEARLSSEAQIAYGRLFSASDRVPDYDGSLTQPGTERPSTLRPYYGVTRVDTGTNSTPTWETDGDPDINPVIADTSTGGGNSTAYMADLIDALRESRDIEGNPFTRETLIELAEHLLSERSDRISTFINQMRSDQREDAIAILRRLVNPETAEAWAVVSVSSLDDILNPVLEPGFDNGTWGISTQLRTLGVVSDDVIRGSSPIRVGALSDSLENARNFADLYGRDRLQVVLRPTSAGNPDVPTYYPTDARSGFDTSGILYPDQELGPMGFHWDDIMYRDPLSPFTLYGFTRGQIRPENVAAIRMTQATYDDLVASGRIADIPDSIQIQIIDGPNGLLNRPPDNGPNVGDAVSDLEETILNESSEVADDEDEVTLGDVFDSPPVSQDAADRAARQRVQEAAQEDSEVDANVPETPDVSVPGVGVEEADEALEAVTPPTPQTPSRPRFPRQPPAAAFEGRADELFSGTRTWQGVKKILDDNDVIFIDYETTGIQTDEYGRVVSNGLPTQIGAVRMRGGKVVDRFNVYINPGRPLSEWEPWSRDNLRDADGNPITQDFLDGQISINDAHRQFAQWAGPGAILGMQNAIFDNEVLTRSLEENGISWRPDGILDTKEIADMTLPRWTPENPVGPTRTLPDGTVQASNSLADITRYLGVELGARHHTADYDAAATGEVLQRIVEGGIEGRWGADVLDPDKRDAKELQNQQDFNEAIERFIAANEAWRKANAPDERPLQIETTPPVARQRRGEAGGSDVKPRVRREAVRQEQEREAVAEEAPETPTASTESVPATPAPKKRQRSGESTSGERNAQPENTASALDREITPVVGRYRVFRDENGEWTNPDAQTLEDNPDLYERETAEFLMEQTNALRRQYRDTLRAIERDTEEMRATAESLGDSRGDVDESEAGDAATSNVQIDQLRTNILQNQNLLQRIESAMNRIEDGTYGLSRGMTARGVITQSAEASNRPIPAARLQAIPTANHRVDEATPLDELASSAPATGGATASPARAPRRRASAPAAAQVDDVEDAAPEAAPAPPRADIVPDGLRNRNYTISTDPKLLDRPLRVPDFSNYGLPYDPSKTYQRPVGRYMSMMLDALGIDSGAGGSRDAEASLARAVRAAFDEPDWSDEYALGRMFRIVDEATDYDLDEAQVNQSAEMMARVQEMIASMIDEQISTAEGLTRPGSRINIDMSDDGEAPAGPLTPIVRGREANRYNQLLERLRDPDGGFTFSLTEFDDVKTGWAIARKGYGIKLPASELFSDDEEKMQDAIDRLEAMTQLRRQELLERGTEEGRVIALGAWHDPVDGTVYFDVVDVYSKDRMSLEEAIAEGKNQNQLKITDLDVLQLALADDNWSRPIFLESGGNGRDVTDPVLLGRYVDLIRAERLAGTTPEAQPESGSDAKARRTTTNLMTPHVGKVENVEDYGNNVTGSVNITSTPLSFLAFRDDPGVVISWQVSRTPELPLGDSGDNAAMATVEIRGNRGEWVVQSAYLPRTAQRGRSLQSLINRAYKKAAAQWVREYKQRRGEDALGQMAEADIMNPISIDGDIPDLIAMSQEEYRNRS